MQQQLAEIPADSC